MAPNRWSVHTVFAYKQTVDHRVPQSQIKQQAPLSCQQVNMDTLYCHNKCWVRQTSTSRNVVGISAFSPQFLKIICRPSKDHNKLKRLWHAKLPNQGQCLSRCGLSKGTGIIDWRSVTIRAKGRETEDQIYWMRSEEKTESVDIKLRCDVESSACHYNTNLYTTQRPLY